MSNSNENHGAALDKAAPIAPKNLDDLSTLYLSAFQSKPDDPLTPQESPMESGASSKDRLKFQEALIQVSAQVEEQQKILQMLAAEGNHLTKVEAALIQARNTIADHKKLLGLLQKKNFQLEKRIEALTTSLEKDDLPREILEAEVEQGAVHAVDSVNIVNLNIKQPKERPVERERRLNGAVLDDQVGAQEEGSPLHRLTEPVTKLFEAQVERKGDYPAIVYREGFLSFQELNEQANQFARFLQAEGVIPGMTVGVILPKSLDFVVLMVALAKCGAVYLPLDIDSGVKRLDSIINRAKLDLIVSTGDIRDRTSEMVLESLDLILIDQVKGEIAHLLPDNFAYGPNLDDPMYTVYLSAFPSPLGITGDHRLFNRQIEWTVQAAPYQDGDVACHTSPLDRIESIIEIWAPLLAGIPTILLPTKTINDPVELATYLSDTRISRICSTPSQLQNFLHSIDNEHLAFENLNVWFVHGEPLNDDVLPLFSAQFPGVRLVALYNISELGGVVAFNNLLPAGDDLAVDQKVIGTPINNHQIFVQIEEDGADSMPNVGEIWVSTLKTDVANYTTPAKNEEFFFVPWPAQPGDDTIFFQTGDMGELLDDGNIRFLGRKDDLVKVYGHRVDLKEIESLMLSHNQVEAVAVHLNYRANRSPQLTAYAQLVNKKRKISARAWRNYLREYLPIYMIPSRFFYVDQLPTSGRDEKSSEIARIFAAAENEIARDFREPRNEIEKSIVTMLSGMLSADQVGIHDDLFELGLFPYHSQTLVRQLYDQFDVELDVETLFQKPTVVEICAYLRNIMVTRSRNEALNNVEIVEAETRQFHLSSDGLLPIVTDHLYEIVSGMDSEKGCFFVHGSRGNIDYLNGWIENWTHHNLFGIQAPVLRTGLIKNAESIEAIARLYVEMMRKKRPTGPYILGGWLDGGILAFEMAQQLLAAGEEVENLILIETDHPQSRAVIHSFSEKNKEKSGSQFRLFSGLFSKRAEPAEEPSIEFSKFIEDELPIPQELRGDVFQFHLASLLDRYEIEPYSGSLLLVVPSETSGPSGAIGLDRGWKTFATDLSIQEIAGSQGILARDINIEKVVAAITSNINPAPVITKLDI